MAATTTRDVLKEWQKYPIQRYPDTIKEMFTSIKKVPLINKTTPIMSMGSCFASNIAKYLMKNKYNYIITEKSTHDISSANWGSVLNTSSARQIFEYSLSDFNPSLRYWKREDKLQDPYRSGYMYNKKDYETSILLHRENSKTAILNAEVCIITLGLIETWKYKKDNVTLSRVPPIDLLNNSDDYEFYVQTPTDCINDLNTIYNLIKLHNPNCKLILTVSPVPLMATFRTDIDVISANTYSKSVLRVAVDALTKLDDVFYFPSYEYVAYSQNYPYFKDNRHIQPAIIKNIMQLFMNTYILKGN